MSVTPKTELRVLAVLLLVVAFGLVIFTLMNAPDTLKLLHAPWQERFSSQYYHFQITDMIRQTVFIIFPCIALLNTYVAWKLLRRAKRIHHDA